ncbi:MAG TPA: 4Fe-4S cluster-binding domain-containing protein [Methanoregulaceae archaeon]|nr:4Fe-4S cluster-binding domain-containing protein [Methanoregulaceae archaeon]HRY75717.1 4Fe-4S cluster-binding domain-containing protein [Methanoregulaceae archaeon]
MSCEHCFVCSSPSSQGTFTPSQVSALLDQTDALGTVDTIYFEGGEPFLFYPSLLDGIRKAKTRGYKTGIVTNGYFATSEENARFFLDPFRDIGITDLSISDDIFHYEDRQENAVLCIQLPAGRPGKQISPLLPPQSVTRVANLPVSVRNDTMTEKSASARW